MIAPEVVYHPELVNREYLTAYQSIKQRWIATLRKYDRFPDTTSYENFQRLALIMRENLDRELGKEAADAERRWYNNNRVEDLSRLSSLLLKSYRRFISSFFPHVLDFEKQLRLDNLILSELSSRKGLDPYEREAYTYAYEYNKRLETQ